MTPRDQLLRQIVMAASGVSSPNVEAFCAKLEKLSSPVTQRELDVLVNTAVQPEARAVYSVLLNVWQQSATDLSPQALAWALRAANATDVHHRTRQSLEMVWSGPPRRRDRVSAHRSSTAGIDRPRKDLDDRRDVRGVQDSEHCCGVGEGIRAWRQCHPDSGISRGK